MSDVPKGRPPLEPRIKALEDGWNALVASLREDFLAERAILGARIKNVEELCEALAGIIAANDAETQVLKKQIAAMNDAFSHGNIPRPQYESQFKVWPGAQSDGTR